MDRAIYGDFFIVITAPLIFLILRKIFPYLSKFDKGDRSLEDYKKEYQKWEIFSAIVLVLSTSVASVIWWFIFSRIWLLNVYRFKDAAFCIFAPSGWAWFPAMSAGFAIGGLSVGKLLKVILKGRYREYIYYQNQKINLNTGALEKPFLMILGIMTWIMLILLLNWYTIFTPEQISYKKFFSLSEKKYRYSDIAAIITVPAFAASNGNVIKEREYVIKFNNGEKWTTGFILAVNLPPEQKAQIMQYVSKRSKIAITERVVLKEDEVN